MNIFTNEYGSIRPWVEVVGYGLVVIGLAVITVLLLAGMGQTEYENFTVTRKEERSTGITCFSILVLHCSQNYDYYVNDKKVNQQIYEILEEGKTYRCEEKVFSGDYLNCEEMENE